MPEAQPAQKPVTPTIQPVPTYARKDAEYLRRTHAIDMPAGFNVQHLTAPETWAHLGAEFRVWDRVECRAADGTWFAELVVTATARTWAKMAVLNFTPLSSTDVSLTEAHQAEQQTKPAATQHPPASDGLKVVHRGPRAWSVVRESDKAVLAEDLSTKDEAEAKRAKLAGVAATAT